MLPTPLYNGTCVVGDCSISPSLLSYSPSSPVKEKKGEKDEKQNEERKELLAEMYDSC